MLSLAALSLLSVAVAQKVGDDTPETHPRLNWQQCTSSGCSNVNGEVVIDANWRWFHNGNYENCYDGNEWTGICSSDDECAEMCHAEGARYGETYGVSTSGNALNLKFVTDHPYGKNIGSRLYLMKDTNTSAISAKPKFHPPAPQPPAASRQLPTCHCLIIRQPPKPCAKPVAGKA
jgi:cellulose 1,4-beta-cellobiosidase